MPFNNPSPKNPNHNHVCAASGATEGMFPNLTTRGNFQTHHCELGFKNLAFDNEKGNALNRVSLPVLIT